MSDDWPHWRDSGRRVRVGDVEGTLQANDCFFDGEDEHPLFDVELPDGTTRSFTELVFPGRGVEVEWQYLDGGAGRN